MGDNQSSVLGGRGAMRAVVCALLVAAAMGQTIYTNPDCPATVPIQDKTTGKVYNYNIVQAKTDNSDKNSFIKGAEGSATWTAYLNICGDAQAAGCSKATPICQDDGGGSFVSMGTPDSWTMQGYFDPKKGKTS